MALVQAPTGTPDCWRGSTRWPSSASPTSVHWFDGSDAEHELLCKQLVDAGTFTALDPGKRPELATGPTPTRATSPGSRTAPSSARPSEVDAGPTNNWQDPAEMRAKLDELFRGCHARPHDVRRAVQHGPARLAAVATSASSSPTRRTSR